MYSAGVNTHVDRALPAARMLRRACVFLLVVVGLIYFTPIALAQPRLDSPSNAVPPEIHERLQERGDLTLDDVTFRQALFTINKVWDVNIFAATDVEGTVSGVFTDAPLHEILDSILLSNGLTYRPVGKTLVVMKLEELGDFNPMFESATISLRAASPIDVLPGAELLKSPRGKVQAIDVSRSLLVIDFADRVQMIREFATQLDQAAMHTAGAAGELQFQIGHWAPQFIKVEALQDPIESVMNSSQGGVEGAATGQVSIIEAENRVVVVGTPKQLELVDRVVRQMDIPRMQVRITALIYDVSLKDMEDLGINWNHAVKGNVQADGTANQLLSVDSLMKVPAAAGDPSGMLTFMNLSRHFDLTAVIDALNECDNTQLLADPSVTVTDRNEASIEIVTEIPYQQLQETSQGGSIGTTAFRKAGVMLKVTPQIANDDTVLLECAPSFSRLAGFTDGQNPQPIIDTREAMTTVRVLNHQTLVIGGLRQRDDIGDFRGIIGLQNIKFLHIGKLFRHRLTSIKESELIVFITPDIVPLEYIGRPREVGTLYYSNQHMDGIPPAGCAPFPAPRCQPVPIEVIQPDIVPSEVLPNPDPHAAPIEPPPGEGQVLRPLPTQQPWNGQPAAMGPKVMGPPPPQPIVHRLPANPTHSPNQPPQMVNRRRYPLGPSYGEQHSPLPEIVQQPLMPTQTNRVDVARRVVRPQGNPTNGSPSPATNSP